MGYTITEKIISNHLLEGEMVKGKEIGIRICQTLTQDSTGTMAYLQFEALGIPKVKTEASVAYIDHNMLQEGPLNADDHKYIQTAAEKYGVYFSRPGNGICHQVHLERFGKTGATLLGSDSHTPTCGSIGMLAIGAGGLDVACAMGGFPYSFIMPKIVNVRLSGKLSPYVSAKDVILELLKRLSVKGGVGKVMEYSGPGVGSLSVYERATITNMGAELGATTSIFPSDDVTKAFFAAQGREEAFSPLTADEDAIYDEIVEIDLCTLEPLAAMPHSPDNIRKIREIEGLQIDQVLIGSCTNGSYADLMKAAKVLKGKTVHSNVSLAISPGSKQTLTMLSANGALTDLLEAGARLLETGCGPCIGMGQSPKTNAVSLRTFNRNFKGRSGTDSADVYLVSPETAAISAIKGELADPRSIGGRLDISLPDSYSVNDNMVIPPKPDGEPVDIIRGPNIKPFPVNKQLEGDINGKALIIVGDNITTDHIMPSSARLLPYRSNIPYLADYCLTACDTEFPKRAKEHGGGIIIAGENYGQGSSREHAALAPLQLGIKAVIAKSFARIHKANLINSGIIPLVFADVNDYANFTILDDIIIEDAASQVLKREVYIKGSNIKLLLEASDKELKILLAGGKINQYRKEALSGRQV